MSDFVRREKCRHGVPFPQPCDECDFEYGDEPDDRYEDDEEEEDDDPDDYDDGGEG